MVYYVNVQGTPDKCKLISELDEQKPGINHNIRKLKVYSEGCRHSCSTVIRRSRFTNAQFHCFIAEQFCDQITKHNKLVRTTIIPAEVKLSKMPHSPSPQDTGFVREPYPVFLACIKTLVPYSTWQPVAGPVCRRRFTRCIIITRNMYCLRDVFCNE